MMLDVQSIKTLVNIIVMWLLLFTVYIVAPLDIHLRKDQARAIPTFFIAM